MQNSAVWVSTTPDGYRVRVRFLPMNAQETERTQRLLRKFAVGVTMVTGEGPLSVDLYFTDRDMLPETPVVQAGKVSSDSALTTEQQAAMDKPASKA
jgi:hypothetical protein